MKVRRATVGDFSQAEALFEEFMNESLADFGTSIEKGALNQTMQELVETCLVLENKDGKVIGLLAGKIISDPMSGAKIFQEVVWYVAKAHRRYGVFLIKEMEGRLRSEGIKVMIMVHMGNSMPEKVARFYEGMGYTHLECHYIKRI